MARFPTHAVARIASIGLLALAGATTAAGGSMVGEWIAFVGAKSKGQPIGCAGATVDEHAPRTVHCFTYSGNWSSFKSDWEAAMGRYDLPGSPRARSAWTLRDGRYERSYEIAENEVVVRFDAASGALLFLHDPLDVQDDDQLAASARSRPSRPGEARSAEAAPLTAGFGGVSTPRLIAEARVQPDYPEPARAAGREGSVILDAVIRQDGTVSDLKILAERPEGLGFGEAALAAVRQWRYEPAVQAGTAVDAMYTIYVEFTLPVENAD